MPQRGLVLAWNNDAAKEWGTLLSRALSRSDISYKPKVNSRKVQGDRNRAKERLAAGIQEGDKKSWGRCKRTGSVA